MRILLVGVPNSGKTTLFNLLTGLNQRTGNYPGVTVDICHGFIKKNIFNTEVQVVDLPGVYSLYAQSEDEKSVLVFLKEQYRPETDMVWLVGEASRPFKNFFLLTQLADMGIHPALVYNMRDELPGFVSLSSLPEEFCGFPLVWIQAGGRQPDIAPLKKIFSKPRTNSSVHFRNMKEFPTTESYKNFVFSFIRPDVCPQNSSILKEDVQLRTNHVKYLCRIFPVKFHPPSFSARADRFLLNPWWGSISFLLLLCMLFGVVFYVSEFFMQGIENTMAGLSGIIHNTNIAWNLKDLLMNGVIPGLTGVLMFVPQIFLLYFIILAIENSGILMRFSFIFDKPLRKIGLTGYTLMSLLGATACAIPAILSLRAYKEYSVKKRLIWLIPLVSCSARIPVYLMFVYLLVSIQPAWQSFRALIFFVLFFSGPFLLIVLSVFLKKISFFKSSDAVQILEMPPLRYPSLRRLFIQSFLKVMDFIREASVIIFFLSVILWFLSSYGPERSFWKSNGASEFSYNNSWLSKAGRWIHPVFEPLGFDERTSVAILASLSAREVFVGTLGVLYGEENEMKLKEKLLQAENEKGEKIFTVPVCVSLLVFYVFALQCISTLSVTYVECGKKLFPVFLQFLSYSVFAWVMAFLSFRVSVFFI